jgi:hypothetical protein
LPRKKTEKQTTGKVLRRCFDLAASAAVVSNGRAAMEEKGGGKDGR